MLRIFTPLVSTSVRWLINLSLYCGGKSFQNYSSRIVFFFFGTGVPTAGAESKTDKSFLLGKNLTVRPGYNNTFCYWIPDMNPVSLCWFKPKLNFHPYPKQFERGKFLTEKIMLGIRCGDVACLFCDQIQLRNFWHHSDYYYVFFTESE